MSDFGRTNPHEALSGRPLSSTTSEPSAAGSSGGTGTGTGTDPARRPRVRRLLANKRRRWIVGAGALVCAVIGLSVGVVTSRSTTAANPVPATSFAGGGGSGGGASNARSGPAAGGASGTVDSVSTSSFTMTTSAGQKVTVDEASTTTYENGTNSTSANAVATGVGVLALGTTNGTTITATQVIVTPDGGDGSATSSAAPVIPFQRGAPATSQQVGEIPANWNEGSGTIVSGTTANNATEAALAAYPGGIVNRVVDLSNGEYNVHYFGVNWPHHVFVNQDFKVVGAL
jgi:hypothetical protein